MTGGPIVLTVEMTGDMTPIRSYNVRENDRRFDRWINSSVDPFIGSKELYDQRTNSTNIDVCRS